MGACKDFRDSAKCDLVIDAIQTSFGQFMDKEPKQKAPLMLHHSTEIKARCIDCDQIYWFFKTDLKVEEFGQLWRTAVFSKEFKP